MEKRRRSPNYPKISLKEAINKLRMVDDAIGQHETSRDVVAKSMGYSGISGASASTISALKKYGLLEGRGEDLRISDTAMAILHPHSNDEKASALREVAFGPALFRDISEKFPGEIRSDELLRNYLIRNKFSPSAVDPAISAYKETIEFVNSEVGLYDSEDENLEGSEAMQAHEISHSQNPKTPPPKQRSPEAEVEIGGIGFKGVGFVKIMADPSLSTEKALSMAQQVINMMNDELKANAPANTAVLERNEDVPDKTE